jgi:hypothetical protein
MCRHVPLMSNPIVPVKTPLGHQELRQRTQRLGQRYRTVLLLVDGRRPLADVLSMAHQAGAQTAHFEELLRLGMIELPSLPEPPELPEPPTDVPDDAPGDAGSVETVPEAPVSVAVAAVPELQESVAAEAGAAPAAPAVLPATASPATAPVASRAAAPASLATEERLGEARRLLIDTLRRDTLLLRVFAPARVRAAQTQEELIGLVWEIERERAHVRRKRGQLLNLQRARDLLGMGNTVVAEDSLPWIAPDEDG